MITQIFLKLLNMSISAGWVALAVMALRIFFNKAPKWVRCVLWSVVALRLIMPFTVQSGISLIPSPEVIPQDIIQSETPAIHSAIPVVNNAVNPLFTGYLTPEKSLLEKGLLIASVIWAVGMGIMLLYSLFAYRKIRRQVRGSIRQDKNVYICDDVGSPFILGTFAPKIYIPSGMEEAQLFYVLAHERAHIKRGDHWWKPLGFLLLTVHWFNPLLWAAYLLLCRDIELACDEKVIAGMDSDGKRGYSEALLACSVHRRMVMACPVAFGELSVKSRIKSVLRYRKPAFWVALAALAVCVATAGCFLTDPLPCVHAYQSAVVAEATCTSRGVERRTCGKCQHMYTAYVDMREHSYHQSVVTLAPTCTQPGERSATCADCGQVFVEVLPVNDVHDMQETVLRKPTCADPGEGVKTCTRCGRSESISYQKVAHNYKKGKEFPSTCFRQGSKQKVCTVCGHEVWISLPTNDKHIWSEMRKGYDFCVLCGNMKSDSKSRNNNSLLDSVTGNKTQPAIPQLPSIRWDVRP